MSRVGLHGTPEVGEAWRRFQDDAPMVTEDGRNRLVASIQAARTQLGQGPVTDADCAYCCLAQGGEPYVSGSTRSVDRRS